MNSVYVLAKGQLISRRLFGILNSSKKTNEKIRLHNYDTSGRLVSVRFLEEFEDTKKTFRNKLTFNIIAAFETESFSVLVFSS